MTSPKEIIENIRRDKSETSPENIKTMNSLLKIVSDDIYSKNVHFVLELIQNADDNKYNDEKTSFLKFIIEPDKILIQNNEIGFMEANVRALCDVNDSTKTKKEGYIGEKGIGFKSVFKISDEPHIFSNGFQFKFRSSDEKSRIGFILPYWIDEIPSSIDPLLTNILLPLKNNVMEEISQFKEIEPELLLFLRNLSEIEIQNKTNNIFQRYKKDTRDEKKNGIVKICSNDRQQLYRLVSKKLECSKEVQEDKRNLETTKIVLGFPIYENGSSNIESEQKVFAFLPLQSYGFKFMIQADFLVPANRQSIHEYPEWNKWLRDNISMVFLEAVETFKNVENLKTSFYNYIPIESEITGEFFPEVVGQLKDKLSDSNCVLTESGKWLKPSQIFRASEEIRLLISNDDLLEFCDKEYISLEVENKTEEEVLKFLEISEFENDNLIKILKNTELLARKPDEWLIQLYDYLKKKLDDNEIERIKDLNIIRLEDDKMVSPNKKNEKPVFFHFKSKEYGFEKSLRFIKNATTKGNRKFLEKIGVSEPTPFEIIENYILKDFEDKDEKQNWKSKSEEVRIGYINYIKDNLDEYEERDGNVDNLGNKVWVTLKDNKFEMPNKIYLSKEYGNVYDLEFLLKGIDDISFVHPQYLKLSKNQITEKETNKTKLKEKLEKAKKEWKDFFIKLGVETKPRIEKEGSATYPTYNSKIINSILQESNSSKNLILLKILDSNWNYYKLNLRDSVPYKPYRGRTYYTNYEESNWYKNIKNSAWLPAKDGSFKKPSELFEDKPEIRKTLGDSVPYLNAEIKNPDFIKALSINSTVTVYKVLDILQNLINEGCTDTEAFIKLYSFLDKNFEDDEDYIRNKFQENDLIFIPETLHKYISSEKVLWKDVSSVFGDYRYYLEKFYPKLRDFFVKKIGIAEKPIAKHYADILIELSQKDSIEKTDKDRILNIYKALNTFLNAGNDEVSIAGESWWSGFVKKDIFWTNKSNFWKNNDDVFVNDDDELYELFKDKDTVAFLEIPQNENPKFGCFIKETGLKYLSEEIKSEIKTSVECDFDEKLTKEINDLLIYIFRYLYHKENDSNDSLYKNTKKDGRLLRLIDLKCFGVLDLDIDYTLRTESVTKDDILFLDINKLYVKIDSLKDYERISIELAKIFGSPKGFSDFVENLFNKPSNEKRNESLKVKKIGDLPKDEQEWFEKHFAKISEIELSSNNTDIVEDVEIEETHDIDLIVENDEQISDDLSKKYVQDNSSQKNQKTELSRIEPKSQSSLTQSTNQPKQTLPPTIQNDSLQKSEWKSKVNPSEINIKLSKPIIPDVKPSFNINNYDSRKPSSILETQQNKGSESENLSPQSKINLGRSGEEFAFEYLRKHFLEKYPRIKIENTEDGFIGQLNEKVIVEVVWLNKNGDSGVGRDIDYIENGQKHYVEVKATIANDKELIHISKAEWQLAKEKQENYHIFRVYNAGTDKARRDEYINPYKLWEENRFTLHSISLEF